MYYLNITLMRLPGLFSLLQRLLGVVHLLLDVGCLLLSLDERGPFLLDGILLLTNVGINLGEFPLAFAVLFLGFFDLLLDGLFLFFNLDEVFSFGRALLFALFDATLVVEELEQLNLNLENTIFVQS